MFFILAGEHAFWSLFGRWLWPDRALALKTVHVFFYFSRRASLLEPFWALALACLGPGPENRLRFFYFSRMPARAGPLPWPGREPSDGPSEEQNRFPSPLFCLSPPASDRPTAGCGMRDATGFRKRRIKGRRRMNILLESNSFVLKWILHIHGICRNPYYHVI